MDTQWAQLMPDAAERLLGEPNKALSNDRRLRWGRRGSLSVDARKGIW